MGHQGWLVSTERTSVLIDPLLTAGFGHGGLVGDAYPPRLVDDSAFPPIDAVVLTHEHDDHFDLPSLSRVDRRVPIYLSARSSLAAERVLGELGFAVSRIEPSEQYSIGDLRYRTLVTEHRDGRGGDEWDVLPFLISDDGGDGSLFSSVDVKPDPRGLERLASLGGRPGIWCVANNTTAPIFGPGGGTDDTEAAANVLVRRHGVVTEAWGAPVCTAVVGTGWSYPEPRAWMNRRAFSVDLERVANEIAARVRGAPALAMKPGQEIALRRGDVVYTDGQSTFMAVSPRDDWPIRTPDPRGAGTRSLAPCSPPSNFGVDQMRRLVLELQDFARFSYGRAPFRGLHSAARSSLDGRRVQLCFDLHLGSGGERCVLAYDPRGCCFEVAPQASADEYISGYECWAADLLGFLVGDIGPSALCNAGRLRVWNRAPDLVRVSPHDLWMFGHPLRRPQAHARLYTKLREELRAGSPTIQAAATLRA